LLLVAGAALAIALLAQTAINYRYVSNNLIEQEARRVASERVRNVERTARSSRPQDAEAFRVLLDDVRAELADEVAGLAIRQTDGTLLAASGQPSEVIAVDPRGRLVADRETPLARETRDGREVLVGLFPCRCSLPRQAGAIGQPSGTVAQPGPSAQTPGPSSQPPGGPRLLLVEIALYRDSLSAPFARLRRDALVSSSAAMALLASLALIAARFGPYVRGKQLEAQAELARQVQRDLLPAAGTLPAGVDVAAECVSASQVGGDFYDVVALPGDRVSFVLGDVSGHGISAALLMGLIHGAMSSPPWGMDEDDPGRAAERLNQLLLAKSSGERFASLFWCAYDPASRTLRYINAGHPPALWIRHVSDGTRAVDRLTEGGPVLGLLAGARYQTVSEPASDGDLLVLYSDGIVEAANRHDEDFGEGRLIAVVQQHQDVPARAIRDAIRAALNAFTGERPAVDDQTLLVVRLWGAGQVGPR